MDFLAEAKAMESELLMNRRYLHMYPGIGFDLDITSEYVESKLIEYGYERQRVGKGISATVGTGGKTILLRADMDGLPMKEDTGLPFTSKTDACHACGHDCHTAVLLGAAKLLKQHESELKGTVKFMFQPAEEHLAGCKDMIENGILENPKVDVAYGMHIMAGMDYSKIGSVNYSRSVVTLSADAIEIEIFGKDAHGSKPYQGIDTINVAAHIILNLQTIVAREVDTDDVNIVTVGKIEGGTAVNSIGGYTKIQVCCRASGNDLRDYLVKRVYEICEQTAAMFGATVKITPFHTAPALENDTELVDTLVGYTKEILADDMVNEMGMMGGGEDFSFMASAVPTAFFVLGAGAIEEGYPRGIHCADVIFNEDSLAVGAATYAHLAMRWLEDNA